jgi:hypothetical protein
VKPLVLALLLTAQAPDPAPEPPPDVVEPAPGPSCWPGAGAVGALGAGVAVPAAAITALSLVLAQMYAGAMAGTCIGPGPALAAVGGFTLIGATVLCAGPLIPTGIAATTAYLAQADGRSPTPAFVGAMPGMACGWIGACLGCAAFPIGTFGGFTNGVITAAIAVPFLACAGPCAACGATSADLGAALYTSLTATPPSAPESPPAQAAVAAMAY